MPKFFPRIVALLLIPCLLADPNLAVVFSKENLSPVCLNSVQKVSNKTAFNEQALEPAAVGATEYIFASVRAQNAAIQHRVSPKSEIPASPPLARDIDSLTDQEMRALLETRRQGKVLATLDAFDELVRQDGLMDSGVNGRARQLLDSSRYLEYLRDISVLAIAEPQVLRSSTVRSLEAIVRYGGLDSGWAAIGGTFERIADKRSDLLESSTLESAESLLQPEWAPREERSVIQRSALRLIAAMAHPDNPFDFSGLFRPMAGTLRNLRNGAALGEAIQRIAENSRTPIPAAIVAVLHQTLFSNDLRDHEIRNLTRALLAIARKNPSVFSAYRFDFQDLWARSKILNETFLLLFEAIAERDLALGVPLAEDLYLSMGHKIREIAEEDPGSIQPGTVRSLETVIAHGNLTPDSMEQISLALGAIAGTRSDLLSSSTFEAALSLLSYRKTETDLLLGRIHQGALRVIAAFIKTRKGENFSGLLVQISPLLTELDTTEAASDAITTILSNRYAPVTDSLLTALEEAFYPDFRTPNENKALTKTIELIAQKEASRLSPEIRSNLETVLRDEKEFQETYFSATLALWAMNQAVASPAGSLSSRIAQLPKPVMVAHSWPHDWIYSNEHFLQATQGYAPVAQFSVALATHRLLQQYRPDLSDPHDSLVGRTVDFIISKRAALSGRLVFGPGVHVINIFHTEMGPDRDGVETYQRSKGVASIQSFTGSKDKKAALWAISTSPGPLVIYFDGHGGANHFWLDEGKPGHEYSDEMQRDDAISYVEQAKALESRLVALDEVTILYDQCFSSNLAENLKDKLAELQAPSQPTIDASNNYDARSYYTKGEPNSSVFFKALQKADPGSEVRFDQLLRAEEFGFTHQDSTVFVPVNEEEIQHLFGVEAYQRARIRLSKRQADASKKSLFTAMGQPDISLSGEALEAQPPRRSGMIQVQVGLLWYLTELAMGRTPAQARRLWWAKLAPEWGWVVVIIHFLMPRVPLHGMALLGGMFVAHIPRMWKALIADAQAPPTPGRLARGMIVPTLIYGAYMMVAKTHPDSWPYLAAAVAFQYLIDGTVLWIQRRRERTAAPGLDVAGTFLKAAVIGTALGVGIAKLSEMPEHIKRAVISTIGDTGLLMQYTITVLLAALVLVLVGQFFALFDFGRFSNKRRSISWLRGTGVVLLSLAALLATVDLSDPVRFNVWQFLYGRTAEGQLANGKIRNITELVSRGETIDLSDTWKLRVQLTPQEPEEGVTLYLDKNPDLMFGADPLKPRGMPIMLRRTDAKELLYESESLNELDLHNVKISVTGPDGFPLIAQKIEAIPSLKPSGYLWPGRGRHPGPWRDKKWTSQAA